jgi:hypothetical protein
MVPSNQITKTPPATEVADGAFEMTFPVDFSLVVSPVPITHCQLGRSNSSPAFFFYFLDEFRRVQEPLRKCLGTFTKPWRSSDKKKNAMDRDRYEHNLT